MTTQDQPVEQGSTDASDREKIDGVVEQTAQDVAIGSIAAADVREVLQQRLGDAGLTVDDAELDALTARAASN